MSRGQSVLAILALVFHDSVALNWEVAAIPGLLATWSPRSFLTTWSPYKQLASKIKGLSAEIFLQILWSTPFHPACQPGFKWKHAGMCTYTPSCPKQLVSWPHTTTYDSKIGRRSEDIEDFFTHQGLIVNGASQFLVVLFVPAKLRA